MVKNVPGTAPLVHVAQITVGGGSAGDHTCARLVAKTALCWGENFFGQLGDGTRQSTGTVPSIVRDTTGGGALTAIAGIVAGPVATCAAIDEPAHAKCWGFNQGGQFGNGKAHNATRPDPCARRNDHRPTRTSGPRIREPRVSAVSGSGRFAFPG